MTAIEVLSRLSDLGISLLETKDVADLLKISRHSAGKFLETLRKEKLVSKISRGKWYVKGGTLDRLQIAEFLTAPRESYISLQSALFYHGMIEQIPSRVYAVTVDRSKVVETDFGIYSFHHCHPEFFAGFQYIKPYLKLATPEKALVDYFYFSPSRSRQFTRLPELEIPRKFSWAKATKFCEQIPSKRTRTLVRSKLEELKLKALEI